MARDPIHNLVKTTLQNAGWLITYDLYPLKVGGLDMEVDLGAENLIAADAGKTFSSMSKVYDFHLAIGSFLLGNN